MKTLFRSTLVLLTLCFFSCIYGQPATTIILLRHSEKDTVGKDPELSAAGRMRALRLPTLFKDTKPDIMYSTPYVRTRQTLMPWAKEHGLEIKAYDPTDLPGFAAKLKSIKGKTIIVSGHSNTTPVLVNLLIDLTKYSALNDNDYSKLWVVTIKDGKATEKMVEY